MFGRIPIHYTVSGPFLRSLIAIENHYLRPDQMITCCHRIRSHLEPGDYSNCQKVIQKLRTNLESQLHSVSEPFSQKWSFLEWIDIVRFYIFLIDNCPLNLLHENSQIAKLLWEFCLNYCSEVKLGKHDMDFCRDSEIANIIFILLKIDLQ